MAKREKSNEKRPRGRPRKTPDAEPEFPEPTIISRQLNCRYCGSVDIEPLHSTRIVKLGTLDGGAIKGTIIRRSKCRECRRALLFHERNVVISLERYEALRRN